MRCSPLIALAMAGCALSAPAAPQRYRLIPVSSWVTAEVLHFGTSTIRARFGPLQGEATLDWAGQRGEIGIEIATGTVSTGFSIFDARLREPDLLASAAFPAAWFVASQFRFDGQALREVRGEFTLRNVSRPLSLTAIRFSCRPAEGGEVCGGDFEATLKRSEFGADFGIPLVADSVRLLVQIEAQKLP